MTPAQVNRAHKLLSIHGWLSERPEKSTDLRDHIRLELPVQSAFGHLTLTGEIRDQVVSVLRDWARLELMSLGVTAP